MSSVYDGSIRDDNGNKHVGGEYVTGVLRGDNGLRHLYKIVLEISKRCSINKTCSIHIHVGSIVFNKELIISLWKLNQQLEDELYSMMPKSRLSREHCRKMKRVNFDFSKKNVSRDVLIDSYYNQIFEIVSIGKKPSKTVNKKFNHPAGDHCGFNTSTPRYWWLNFIPAMFNLKGEGNETIEFRMHSATLNFSKIKNWLLIVFGIVSVAENNQKFIFDNKDITLRDVMNLAYPSKGKYLSDYIDERKQLFNNPKNKLFENAEYFIDRNIEKVDVSIKDTLWA
jgi:hypothetical protein